MSPLVLVLAQGLAAAAPPDAAAVHAALASDQGWAPVRQDGDVAVSRKALPGLTAEAFRGVQTLPADVDPAALFALLCDVGAHARVSDDVAEAGLLDGAGERVRYYQLIEPPAFVPAAPRYWINEAVHERAVEGEPGHLRRRWSSLDPSAFPEVRAGLEARHPGAVPVDYTFGVWELLPQADGTTLLRYASISHPGGAVPDALTRLIAARAVPATMRAFEEGSRATAGPPPG